MKAKRASTSSASTSTSPATARKPTSQIPQRITDRLPPRKPLAVSPPPILARALATRRITLALLPKPPKCALPSPLAKTVTGLPPRAIARPS